MCIICLKSSWPTLRVWTNIEYMSRFVERPICWRLSGRVLVTRVRVWSDAAAMSLRSRGRRARELVTANGRSITNMLVDVHGHEHMAAPSFHTWIHPATPHRSIHSIHGHVGLPVHCRVVYL